MILYTLGYRGWSYYQFKDKLKEVGAKVIDTRYNPYTVLPFWNKKDLEKDLGIMYRHVPAFGNRNYANGKEISIVDFDSGYNIIYDMFSVGISPLLLCACEEPDACHRSLLAKDIAFRSGCDVIHL